MKSKRTTKGLTLIELMVSLAIASTVAAAVCRLSVTLCRELARPQQTSASSVPELARPVLTLDVAHTQRFRMLEGRLELETLAALEGADLRLRHVPATVTYESRLIEGESWLVRRQRCRTLPPDDRLVCRGVAGIRIDLGEAAGKKAPPEQWRRPNGALKLLLKCSPGGGEQSLVFSQMELP